MVDDQRTTRAGFVRRAGAAGLSLGVALSPRFVGDALGALDAAGDVHHFVSRPDLVPPVLRVLEKRPGTSAGHLFLAPSSGPGRRGAMIADDRGDVIWFHDSNPVVAMNLRTGIYRGRPVLTWWEGKTEHGLGDGTHIVMDQHYREVLRLPSGHGRPSDLHEFVLTRRGTALVTAWESVPTNLSSYGGLANGEVVGGVVQELELPSGRVLFEWRSLDHVGLDETHQGITDRAPWDYFHVNSVELDHDGNYLVSARNTWAVYKVHAGTGEVMWRLGGKKSDFTMGPDTVFAWQHDARRHGGSEYLLSLFDDGAAPAVQPWSKGLVLALDLKRMHASVHRKFVHRPRVLAHALGSVQVLPNRNVLVGWGTAPYITEYGRHGEVLFDAKLPDGGQNYRALRFPWKGTPHRAPDVVVRHRVLSASWNGATEVAAWRLEAAGTTSTHRRTGFETKIALPAGAKRVSITPVDRHGAPLHAAKTVPT